MTTEDQKALPKWLVTLVAEESATACGCPTCIEFGPGGGNERDPLCRGADMAVLAYRIAEAASCEPEDADKKVDDRRGTQHSTTLDADVEDARLLCSCHACHHNEEPVGRTSCAMAAAIFTEIRRSRRAGE